MGISAFLLSPESLPVLTAAAAIQESISRFAGTTMMRLARPCGSQVPVPDLAGCAISGPWVDGGDFVESTGSISGDRPQAPCALGALSRTGPAARQRSRQAMHDGAPKPPFWCPNLLIYFGMCTGAPCEPRIPTWTPVPSWYGFPRIWHTPTRRHGPSPLWSGRQQTGSHHEPDDQHGRRRMQDGNRSLWGRRTPASESRPPLPQGLRQCPVSGQGVSASRVLTRFGVA